MRGDATYGGVLPEGSRRGRQVALVQAGVVLVVSLVVVVGWLGGVQGLTTFGGPVSVKLNTALCLSLVAAALLWPPARPSVRTARAVRAGLAGAALLVATVTLLEYASRTSLGIDELLVDDPQALGTPGRMAGATATCVVLLAVAVLALAADRRRLAQALALVAQLAGFLTLLGHLYGVPELYEVGSLEIMSAPSAACVLLLGVAVVVSVPDGLGAWYIDGTDAGASLLRALLPVTLLGLPVVGYLRLVAQRAGAFNTEFGLAVMVAVVVTVVTGVSVLAAERVRRIDGEREQARADLQQLNDQLEVRVRDGAERLEEQRTRLALADDRDRIAEELHDLVVQRLFDASLELASLQGTLGGRPGGFASGRGTGGDPAVPERIAAVIDELDAAIQDLRAAVFRRSPSA